MMKKYTAIVIVMLMVGAVFSSMSSAEEKFPSKPITVIIPWKPGGGTDVLARAVCPIWEKELGVPLVIQCKPGGANIVGYNALFHAPHDGYTIVFGQGPNYNVNVLFQDAPYGMDDIEFLNMFVRDDALLYCNKNAPWQTLDDLIADAKRRPGEIKFGNVLALDPTLIFLREFEKKAGFKLGENIPMGGGGPLRREVLGGHIMLGIIHVFMLSQLRS